MTITFLYGLSSFQKPAKQGKQTIGCSTYIKFNKSGFDKHYIAPHKRGNIHEDCDEHPLNFNDEDSSRVKQLSCSQQKDMDTKFSIFVGSLTEEVQEKDLIRLFSQFGSLKKPAHIHKQHSLTFFSCRW